MKTTSDTSVYVLALLTALLAHGVKAFIFFSFPFCLFVFLSLFISIFNVRVVSRARARVNELRRFGNSPARQLHRHSGGTIIPA